MRKVGVIGYNRPRGNGMSNGNSNSGSRQYVEFPENVPDVGSFHNDAQRTVDLQAAMLGTGNEHMEGARHDLEARGITTELSGAEAQAAYEAGLAQEGQRQQMFEQHEQMFMPPQPTQSQSQEQDFRQLYGQSENEKGELRRALQAQMDANNALLAQMQVLTAPQVAPPSFFGPPNGHNGGNSYNSGYNNTHAPQYPQHTPSYTPAPYDIPRLMAKGDDEMVLAGDVEQVLREKVAPIVSGLYNMVDEARRDSTDARRQLYELTKAQRGITPQVEQMVLAHPSAQWVRTIPNPMAYLDAVAAVAATLTQPQVQAPTQVRSQAPTNTPNFTPRRITYTEQGNPATNEPTRMSQDQAWGAAWQKTLTDFPYGDPRRAEAQRRLLSTRMGPQVTGYRDPSVVTR